MERTDESSVIVTEHGATAKKIYSFPSFIDAQFWTWQIINFVDVMVYILLLIRLDVEVFLYYGC